MVQVGGIEPPPHGPKPRVLPLYHTWMLVEVIGFEPMTTRLSVECSTRLSYTSMVAVGGFEPPIMGYEPIALDHTRLHRYGADRGSRTPTSFDTSS